MIDLDYRVWTQRAEQQNKSKSWLDLAKESRVVTLGASECSYSHRVAAVMFSSSAAQTPRHIQNGEKKLVWDQTGSPVIFKCHIRGWGCFFFFFPFFRVGWSRWQDNRVHNVWLAILSPVSSCKCRRCCLWAGLPRLCHTSTRGCQSRPGSLQPSQGSAWPHSSLCPCFTCRHFKYLTELAHDCILLRKWTP